MAEQESREVRAPGPAGHGPGKFDKPKNAKATLSRLLKYLLRYRLQLVLVALGIIVSALASVAGTYFIKPIINDYIVPLIGHENPDLSGLLRLIIVLAVIYAFGVAAAYLYQRLMINVSSGVLLRLRSEMYQHMIRLPLKYHDSHGRGELMSRYSNDTDSLRDMLSQGLPQLFSGLLTIVSVFIMMLILSPLLTLLVVVMLALMLAAARVIGGRSAGYFIRQQRELGKINGYIEERVTGIKVVKIFSHEQQTNEEFDQLNGELCDAAKNAHTFANILMPIMGNLSYLNYALVAVVSAAMVISGRLDLGSIGSFLQYTRNFAMPIASISQQFNSILNALAGAERIFRLMDEPLEADHGTVELVNVVTDAQGELRETKERSEQWAWKRPYPSPSPAVAAVTAADGMSSLIALHGDVRFHDVDFAYVAEKPVLHQVSFYAKPGQKIALVGSTGAGKTTITNLLNRFYEIEHGSITYDGIDIREIKQRELRRSLAMVLQDTHLFTGTVRENIRYGRLEATDEEVVAAAKLANADYFIRHLPQGYDTVISGDGANLSAGQRQLLAIARAAVNDPPVLVLDEATSSIDTRTESLIEQGMDKLMVGRTVFVIAHRLSTVRNANAIMVIEQGRIIERGDHQELLDLKGRYYQLYTGSFELE
jgi:ATP-binding cassette, subfamily B, multidrug efflux pump